MWFVPQRLVRWRLGTQCDHVGCDGTFERLGVFRRVGVVLVGTERKNLLSSEC